MSLEKRNSSIRSAVWTSILSKAGTALLQLLALPVAVRVMGWEEFGLYASVAGFLVLVQLFEIGLGPALTHGLSKAVAEGDRERETALSATAFVLLCGLVAVAVLVVGIIIHTTPVSYLFGQAFAPFEGRLKPALWTGLVIFAFSMLLGHTDRVREGYLEVKYNNAWGAAGNFLAAALVGVGVLIAPSISLLLVAVFGTVVLARLGNTIQLWRSRPWLVPRLAYFRGGMARWMVGDSVAYAVFALVVNLVEFTVVQNLYGRLAGPVGVTGYAVLVTITTALLGFVLMFTTPTWPAVVDAKARGDVEWIRGAARKLRLYVVAFALAAGAGLAVLGPWVLPVWVGEKATALNRWVLAAYGFYFLAYAWRHANHMLLVGLGQVRTLAVVQVIESVLVLAAAWAGMHHGGLAALLLAMGITITLCTGWALPMLFSHGTRKAAPPLPAREYETAPG